MEKEIRKLSSHLEGKFVMVGYQPGSFVLNNKKYDTRTMTIVQADDAIKAGASFIKRKEKKA